MSNEDEQIKAAFETFKALRQCGISKAKRLVILEKIINVEYQAS